jgi:hypothetical protein
MNRFHLVRYVMLVLCAATLFSAEEAGRDLVGSSLDQ